MHISDVIAWGSATPVNNRNVQILGDVLLRVHFSTQNKDGSWETIRAGTKFAKAEIEVQQASVRSVRFMLGEKSWTDFATIQDGLSHVVTPADVAQPVEPDKEVEVAQTQEPAVEVTTEPEHEEAAEAEDGVPATEG